MYWGIYDYDTVSKYKPIGKKPILIRILEPSYRKNGIPYRIQYISSYVNILELYFEDIDKPVADKILFDTKMLYKINLFLLNNNFDEIVVHCNAGISRSAAIMVGAAKILNNKEVENYILNSSRFYPNKLILNLFNKSNLYIKKIDYQNFIFTNDFVDTNNLLDIQL